MDEAKRLQSTAELDINELVIRADKILERPLTADKDNTKKTIAELNSAIESFKVAHMDVLSLMQGDEAKKEEKGHFDAVIKDAKQVAEALVDILVPAGGDLNEAKDDKDDKMSTTSTARQRLAAEVAALTARKEALAKKHELEKKRQELARELEKMELEEQTRKTEIERELLKEQEEKEVTFNFHGKGRVEQQERSDLRGVVELLSAPKLELKKFNGDPLEYYYFMRSFEENVERVVKDGASRLTRLVQYCEGRAKVVIQSCQPSEEGYNRAKEILRKRFGDSYTISQAWIKKVTEASNIKGNDSNALQTFADDLRNAYETLHAMGCLAELNTMMNLARIVSKLPVYLQNRWRKNVSDLRRNKKLPAFKDLLLFVEEAQEQASDPVFGLQQTETVSNVKPKIRSSYATGTEVTSVQSKSCVVCSGAHKIYACPSFKSMGPEERLETTRRCKMCFNCLGRRHNSKNCESQGKCQVCGKRHHSLLHRDMGPVSQNVQGPSRVSRLEPQVNSGYIGKATDGKKVVLPIVAVYVKAPGGRESVKTHALLDTGSTSSFCTERLLNALGVQGSSSDIMLNTMAGRGSAKVRIASLEVKGIQSNRTLMISSVLARKAIPIGAHNIITEEDLKEYPHLQGLGVPKISAGEVSLLIGQDVPDALAPINVVKGKQNEPFAIQTAFGWAISGPVARCDGTRMATSYFVSATLERQVEEFWKMDMGGIVENKTMSVNDKKVLDRWQQEKTFFKSHYHLPVPCKEDNPKLPGNREQAEKRLQSLERKLRNDPELKEKYTHEMGKLIERGYAEKVEDAELGRQDGKVWYLPHHAVISPNKPNIRVVFDCAARYGGTSLNEAVHQGPDLTNNLIGVLLRFRQEKVAMMADIEGMFNQVCVAKEDRDMLRFLWWPGGDFTAEPEVYRMRTHLFGGTWSPSCCTFALHQAAEDFGENLKEAQETIRKNLYVDDLLKSVVTVERAIQLSKELKDVLAKAGFNLTKWVSNHKEVTDALLPEDRGCGIQQLVGSGGDMHRALGVHWNIHEDVLSYKVQPVTRPITKRGILGALSSVYDPLGHANPFILKARQMVQELFRRKIGWDDSVPKDIEDSWRGWVEDLPGMTDIKVPRPLKPSQFQEGTTSQLHHFCDASELAYGVVTYMRNEYQGQINSNIVMAKGRLAPLKTVTIPRLELAAADLAVKQDRFLKGELELPLENSQYWTDSSIVIAYITNEEKRFKTFVANRVSSIREASNPSQWRHIASALNPADHISRGLSAWGLQSSEWLEGPKFLKQTQAKWPRSLVSDHIEVADPEVKRSAEVLVTRTEDNGIAKLLRHFSSWMKLKRAVAWILAVKDVLTKKGDPVPNLDADHMKRAEDEIYKQVQRERFGTEIEAIKRSDPKGYDRMKQIQPIIINGMLKVGGRLKHASLDIQIRHPIILPGDHHVTELIIRGLHEGNGHPGQEYVFAETRKRYWIIGGRRAVKQVLRKCILCKKKFSKVCQQQMGDLPAARTTPDRPPFTFCGVDYFGPFLVKRGRGREKRYGCIFTCLTTRALHLEVAHTLEADSFIQCLERFISRRGIPEEMYSDQGTNFTGANRELQEEIKRLNNDKRIQTDFARRGIKWKFNAPGASHAGGVWERMIRSVRKILSGLVNEQTLTDESLSTLFCQVEAILNNRPLTTISPDPQDLNPLTPNHLLIMRTAENLPGIFDDGNNYRKRWRQIEHLANVFWRRWTTEYLTQLQVRHKWTKETRDLKVGDVVLIVEHNSPRSEWLLGRVIEVLPGRDGKVRNVGLQTKKGKQLRPITKVCLLETA